MHADVVHIQITADNRARLKRQPRIRSLTHSYLAIRRWQSLFLVYTVSQWRTNFGNLYFWQARNNVDSFRQTASAHFQKWCAYSTFLVPSLLLTLFAFCCCCFFIIIIFFFFFFFYYYYYCRKRRLNQALSVLSLSLFWCMLCFIYRDSC